MILHILLVIFFLCFSANHNAFSVEPTPMVQEKNEGKVERYSVEKTVEVAKTVLSGHWWGPFSATFDRNKCPLNPDALPELYRILDDTKQQKDWEAVVSYVGLLGNDEDVDKLEKLLQRYKGKTLDFAEETLFYSVICAISAMDRHGIPKAGTAIDNMMSPDYWEKLNVRMPNGRTGVVAFGVVAIGTKSNNTDPDYRKKVKKILANIQDVATKKLYAEAADSGIQNYDALMKARQTGDWTPIYGKQKPKSNAIKRSHPESYYDDFYSSSTLSQTPADLEPSSADVLRKEALAELNLALQATMKSDLKYLITHTAEQGRPLLLPKEQTEENTTQLLSNRKDLKAKWADLMPVVRTVLDKVAEPTSHTIYLQPFFDTRKKTGTYRKSPIPRFNPQECRSYIVVRFRYDALRDVAKKYPEIFNNKGRIPSVSETGEPYVVMIWENDQWYWNPFGM